MQVGMYYWKTCVSVGHLTFMGICGRIAEATI